MEAQRSEWRSFASYVAVTTGAIVGLGNVLQFPFLVVKYGSLFLLFYVLCQLFIALPLLFAEIIMGRRGMQNPVGSIGVLTMESGANPYWRLLGWFCVLITFLTMGYYVVAAAFPVGYFVDNVSAIVIPTTSIDASLLSHFNPLEWCFIALLMMAMFVVYRGINKGLEEISMITVPFYCFILLGLVIYLACSGYFDEPFYYLMSAKINYPVMEIFLAALTLAFLKYDVGMGTMIVYGSYLPYRVSLAKSTVVVLVIDAVVSLLSFFVIYPLTMMVDHGNGIVLSSHNVINIFHGIPNGLWVSAIFFFAVILVAWTPIIAMGETIVITLIERLDWTRKKASIVTFLAVLVLGSIVVATHTTWEHVVLFGQYHAHNLLKNITMDILVPISALLIAIFAGWVMNRRATERELRFNPAIYSLWQFLIRYVVPVGVLLVFGAVLPIW